MDKRLVRLARMPRRIEDPVLSAMHSTLQTLAGRAEQPSIIVDGEELGWSPCGGESFWGRLSFLLLLAEQVGSGRLREIVEADGFTFGPETLKSPLRFPRLVEVPWVRVCRRLPGMRAATGQPAGPEDVIIDGVL